MATKMLRALAASFLIAGATLAAAAFSPAAAQSKVTRMIVAFPPGGPVDLVARLIAEPMAKSLGSAVIVENRAGGNTFIAAQSVATSPADGSVVFLSSMSTVVLNPLLYESMPYNPETDFTPISLVVSNPPVLVVHPSNPAKDAAEFAANAKTGDPVPIGSAGIGGTTHISIELFAQATGAKLLHVPYKGAAPAITDVLGNHVHGFFGDLPGVISYIRAGKLKPLGLQASQQLAVLPGVRTMAEQGINNVESENWYALYAPAKTAPATVAKLNAAVKAALADEEVRKKLMDTGCIIAGSSPEELDSKRKAELARLGALIKARGIKLE